MVSGYQFDSALKIWKRPGFEEGSSDSAGWEERFERIVAAARDRSVHSPELARHCTDCLSLTHFSPLSSNLLRPFAEVLRGNVLEIGAGCGNLSRLMGEGGGQILSLERSVKRASIAALRCSDLGNVTVVAEAFAEFQSEERFDVVTLIGVLRETTGKSLLAKARSLLKPGGRLILAVDNQLGLKHLCHAEDSLDVVTYGRSVLMEHLEEVGLKVEEFLYPFPDYKLPRSIITQKGCLATDFDPFPFMEMNVGAWRAILKNKMLPEMGNSFLISAMPEIPVPKSDILAYHYNTSRKATYCTETVFKSCSKENRVVVKKTAIYSQVDLSDRLFFSLPEEPYVKGKRLLAEWLEMKKISQMATHLQNYIRILCIHIPDLDWDNSKNPYTRLPGKYIDALPGKIIIQEEGSSVLIDQKWEWHQPIELGYLLFRALFDFLSYPLNAFNSAQNLSRAEFLLDTLNLAMGFPLNEDDLRLYSELESELQKEITGQFCKGIYQSLEGPLFSHISSKSKREEVKGCSLAIAAIFRDEAPYLKEWIEFHLLVGVEYFYLVNNLSEDNYLEVLQPYIDRKIVKLISCDREHNEQFDWKRIQCDAYEAILLEARGKVKWLAVLDVDEFLFPMKQESLPEFLEGYEEFGGVVVNVQFFGTSHVPKIPKDKLMIEMLTLKQKKSDGRFFKSIVRPERAFACPSAHGMYYVPGYFHVSFEKKRVEESIPSPIQAEPIRIHHYTCRDEHYLRTQKIPRRQKWHEDFSEWLEWHENLNQIKDESILPLAARLRERIYS